MNIGHMLMGGGVLILAAAYLTKKARKQEEERCAQARAMHDAAINEIVQEHARRKAAHRMQAI